MLDRFGFVVIDVAVKIFFFIFTYQASRILLRAEFDLLSYFRSTLTMCVGALTSTVGLYFLVYGKKMHESAKYGATYVLAPAVFFILLLALLVLTLTLASDTFHLTGILKGMGWLNFFAAILVASLAQVVLIYKKAAGRVNAAAVLPIVLGLALAIGAGYWLLAQKGLVGAAYCICLGYGVLLCLLPIHAKPASKRFSLFNQGVAARRVLLQSLVIWQRFLLPNFMETLFSILAPWLAIYALVANSGVDGVGAVLFYQALIGLPVFLIYSLTLNDHAVYERDAEGDYAVLARFRYLYVAFYGLVSLLGGAAGPYLKGVLNIASVSTFAVVAMFASTLMQAELLSKGMIFKKAGLSVKTLKHNALYSIILSLGAYIFTGLIGIDGYALAVVTSWAAAYVYVNWDFSRTFQSRGRSMWLELGLMAGGFLVLVNQRDVPWSVLLVVTGAFVFSIAASMQRLIRWGRA